MHCLRTALGAYRALSPSLSRSPRSAVYSPGVCLPVASSASMRRQLYPARRIVNMPGNIPGQVLGRLRSEHAPRQQDRKANASPTRIRAGKGQPVFATMPTHIAALGGNITPPHDILDPQGPRFRLLVGAYTRHWPLWRCFLGRGSWSGWLIPGSKPANLPS